MNEEPILVFGGTGSPKLTSNICSHLGVEPGKNETLRFSEGNLFVRILENVRGRNVYLIQSTGYPANDNFMERLEQSTIQKLYVTDTIETQPVEFSDKIEIISVAPLFAEAIRRIHNQESVSVLFET